MVWPLRSLSLRQGGSSLCSKASRTVGGGTRSAVLTLPGFVHDICSAVHPLARASPFLSTLPLAEYDLKWIDPLAPVAHPLDDGGVVVAHRSVDLTAEALGDHLRATSRYVPDAALRDGYVSGGANSLSQLLWRPTFRLYRTSLKGLSICSSSTPPGGRGHGMCGYFATRSALKDGL
jgi:phytoene dehydrogenase-like protein